MEVVPPSACSVGKDNPALCRSGSKGRHLGAAMGGAQFSAEVLANRLHSPRRDDVEDLFGDPLGCKAFYDISK